MTVHHCSENEFIKEAHAAVANKTVIEAQTKRDLEFINNLTEQIQLSLEKNPSDVETQLERYNKI